MTSASIRVFVYPSNLPCLNVRHDKDAHETALRVLLEASPLRTMDPANATIFYHPACLVDHYFHVRSKANGTRMLRAAEGAVLAQIQALGYSRKPHVINALRCWGLGREGRLFERSHIVQAYPRLARNRFARFCTEAMTPVDVSRAVHIPYCAATRRLVRPHGASSVRQSERRTRVLFIGSHLHSRKHVLRALHRQNFSRRLIIINPFRRAAPGMLWCDHQHPLNTDCPDPRGTAIRTPRGIGVNASDALAMMYESTYTLCPAGDAPDSPRVYSALARGSIPLVDPKTSLPPLADWNELSATIRFDGQGTLILPSARRETKLLRGAWAHRHAFECDATNPLFTAYIVRSLARILRASNDTSTRLPERAGGTRSRAQRV